MLGATLKQHPGFKIYHNDDRINKFFVEFDNKADAVAFKLKYMEYNMHEEYIHEIQITNINNNIVNAICFGLNKNNINFKLKYNKHIDGVTNMNITFFFDNMENAVQFKMEYT